ncbi:MAG: hypothetical protein ACREOQ_12665 [Gemmatimonadales bacterium]
MFKWSGRNSHKMRLRASKELELHLNEATRANPGAKHFVVAHSHGGNVALYALRQRALQMRLAGLATLATPFILCEERDIQSGIEKFLLQSLGAVFLAFMFAMVGVSMVALGVYHVSTFVRFGVCLPLELAWIALMFGSFGDVDNMIERLVVFVESKLHTRARRQQTRTVDQLQPPSIATPVLCVQVVRDEPGLGLTVLERLGEAPFAVTSLVEWLTTWWVWIVPAVVCATLSYFIPGDSAIFRASGFFAFLAIISPLAFSVWHLILAWFPQVRRVGFGGESVVDNLFTRIRVQPSPRHSGPFDAISYVLSASGRSWLARRRQLRHSLIDEDATVLRDLGDWMRRISTGR